MEYVGRKTGGEKEGPGGSKDILGRESPGGGGKEREYTLGLK